MPIEYTRRDALELLSALGAAGVVGSGSAVATSSHSHTEAGATLNRLATTVAGAEITGVFLTRDGQLFFNVQHPSETAHGSYRPGAIGAVAGVNMHQLPADFESVQPPESPAEDVKTADGEYQILATSNDETVDGQRLGVPYAADGEPLTDGDDPDFNAFIPTDDAADEGYLFTNWEDVPGMVSRLHLQQSRSTGLWTVLERKNLDFRGIEGTWNNCFGTVTPWDTPLTSEEYEPDARAWFHEAQETYNDQEELIESYLGRFGNAYRYGYIVEIEHPRSDEPDPKKHYAMGRFSHENAVVMPDDRTVYMSDDGTGTVFFKFVADTPGDLSAGTLYAAAAKQQGRGTDPRDVSFKLKWIELAHATDEAVEAWIADYDGQEPSTDPTYVTDEEIQAWANGNAPDDRAAFLESRKAAAAKGATNEFRKMEGVNIRPNATPGDHLYLAMSELNETMRPNSDTDEFDDPQDDVRVDREDAGAVYRLRLDGNYNIHRMEPAVVGGDHATICGGCPYDARPDSNATVCQDCAYNPAADEETPSAEPTDPKGINRATEGTKSLAGRGLASLTERSTSVDPDNTIANPDNIVVLPDGRVIIGEDSTIHEPNMLWMYNPKRS